MIWVVAQAIWPVLLAAAALVRHPARLEQERMTGDGRYADPFHGAMSLNLARELLREQADDGTDCPLCTQRVKVYRRKLTSVAARAVAALYQEHTLDWGHMGDVARKHLPDVANQGGYLVLGQHWGLIEEEARRRDDGGRTGWWRVTALGALWLRGEESVPKYARIYNGRCLGLHGDLVSAEDVLGEGFDFGHLVRAVTPVAERAAGADPFNQQEAA